MRDNELRIRIVRYEQIYWMYVEGVIKVCHYGEVSTAAIIDVINKWLKSKAWKIDTINYKEKTLTDKAFNKYNEKAPLYYGDYEVEDFE